MATPPATPEEFRATQEAIAALALRPLRALWRLWDPSALDQSVPVFRDGLGAVVNHYGDAAAAQSMQHYRAARLDAGATDRFEAPPLVEVPEGFIDEAMVNALADAEADIQRAMADLDAKAEQLVLNQGRQRALTAVNADRFAKGWARVPNPGACSFCMMLAIRSGHGYLYTAVRAFNASNARFKGAGRFKVHDNCRCTLEPVFGQYEPPADVREAMAEWDRVTKGRTGHDARVAWRQHREGREVTGAPNRQARKSTTRDKFEGGQKTPENQRHQLRLLEALPPAKTPAAAEWRKARIAEIRKFLGE